MEKRTELAKVKRLRIFRVDFRKQINTLAFRPDFEEVLVFGEIV